MSFRGSTNGRFKDSGFLVQLTKAPFQTQRVVFACLASVWSLLGNNRRGLRSVTGGFVCTLWLRWILPMKFTNVLAMTFLVYTVSLNKNHVQ
jgi:hypothetical protein